MVAKLQKRFIVAAMTAISLLLLLLLLGLNIANAYVNYSQADKLLNILSEPEPIRPTIGADKPFDRFSNRPKESSWLDAVYFSVNYNAAGEAESINVSRIASIGENEALELAQAADEEKGIVEGFLYKKQTGPGGGFKLTFLDTSMQRSFILRMALISLAAGCVCWVLMLLVVVLLSKKAIAPIAKNIEKQRRFVTDAGHELKTPLAIILANTEAMELRQGENKYSRNIRNQVKRLDGLTKNLLILAKAEENRQDRQLEVLDLSEMVSESAAMFKESAELKQLSLACEIDKRLLVSGSKEQLGSLLSILLDNAVKYSPNGGKVHLKLSGQERPVLEIRNTVVSSDVPTELMFDRFYKADSSRSQKGGSYGIGLSAAQAIVQAHGGTISAEYENENTICFKVKL